MKRRSLFLAAIAVLGLNSASRAVNYQLTTLTNLPPGPFINDNEQIPLIISNNVIYGASEFGGLYAEGQVFSFTVGGAPPKFKVLATFNGSSANTPDGRLLMVGNTLYGTCAGGTGNNGLVYSIPSTGGAITPLGSFTQNCNTPTGGLTLVGSSLYGVTSPAGSDENLFSLPLAGGTATLVQQVGEDISTAGNLLLIGNTLYGTAQSGGVYNRGFVFSEPVAGGPLTIMASFNTSNGSTPSTGLVVSGNTLYGTTAGGGPSGKGTVFSLPVSGGSITTLATFDGITDGALPVGELLIQGDMIYGATKGLLDPNDYGTVYSLPISGGQPTTLASFTGANGIYPCSGVVMDSNGDLYGTTATSDTSPNYGSTLFKLTPLPEPVGLPVLAAAVCYMLSRRKTAQNPGQN